MTLKQYPLEGDVWVVNGVGPLRQYGVYRHHAGGFLSVRLDWMRAPTQRTGDWLGAGLRLGLYYVDQNGNTNQHGDAIQWSPGERGTRSYANFPAGDWAIQVRGIGPSNIVVPDACTWGGSITMNAGNIT